MSAQEIHLMPDWTVFVQLGIFLVTMGILHVFVFKPVLRLLDKRRELTADTKTAAEKLNSDAEVLDNARVQTISKEMEKVDAQCAVMIADKRRNAEKMISDARAEAKRVLDSTDVSVEISEQAVAVLMKKKAGELAKEIAVQVMDGVPS